MKTPAVSILVPIYNVSNFIERCAHSLFGQTFDDIEYVFVDDCTPDDSIAKLQKVIEQYPNREPNVKIVHHEKNRGLAAARNTAIDNSTGKYIQHIDSDDWVEIDMIEQMYKKAEEEKADIVVCDIFVERQHETIIFPSSLSKSNNEHLCDLLSGDICNTLWNKLIIRKLCELPENRVPEGLNCGEDAHVVFRIFANANKIVKAKKTLYHYNKCNANAYSRNITQKSFENFALYWHLLDTYLIEKHFDTKIVETAKYMRIKDKISMLLFADTFKLCKKYAFLFRETEMQYFSKFHLAEKLLLFFLHYRIYFAAHFIYYLWFLKYKRKK